MHKFLVTVDQWWAAILLNRFGITLSSWSAVSAHSNIFARWLRSLLEWISPGHTHAAVLADEERLQATLDYLATYKG